MNHLQTNTSGLNAVIKTLQTDIYDALDTKYTNLEIEGYGKVYKNPMGNEYIPEAWNETQKQYQEVFLDDSKPYSFYFIVGEEHSTEDFQTFMAPARIAVIVDLSKLNELSRVDSEAHRDFVGILRNDTDGHFVWDKGGNLLTGVDSVFSGFKRDQIRMDDMQPWHIFALQGKISYTLKKSC